MQSTGTARTFKRAFKDLTGSSLLRYFVLGFLCLALVEALFTTLVSIEVFNAGKAADAEYQVLQTAQDISALSDKLRAHRKAVDDGEYMADQPAIQLAHERSCAIIQEELSRLYAQWHSTNLDRQALQHIMNATTRLLTDGRAVYLPNITQDERSKVHARFIESEGLFYAEAMQEIQKIQQSVREQRITIDSGKITFLLLAAAVVNALLCALIAYLLEMKLARPLSRLADRCEQLLDGKAMPPPATMRNEVSRLEATFHSMSMVVSTNEKGRRSYAELLQEVQAATLNRVRAAVASIGQSTSPHFTRRNTLEPLLNNLDRMLQLLKYLADGLRQDNADHIDVVHSTVQTQALIEKAVVAVDSLVKKRSVTIVVEMDEDRPIEVDAALIERVLINFLSNAIKYSPDGGTIKLKADFGGDQLTVTVVDSGPGISPENQERLFEKFSKLESADGVRRPGTGLGLAICKQIVEAHGGRIGCHSAVGSGSQFWFAVPLHASASSVAPQVVAKQARRSRGSIKLVFIPMLIVFVICQALLAFNLQIKFNQSAERAAAFADNKEVIIQTQELLALFLNWREQAKLAAQRRDIQAFLEIFPLLRQQQAASSRLVSITHGRPALRQMAEQIESHVNILEAFCRHYMRKIMSLNMDEIEKAMARADLQAKAIENLLFDSLKREGFELRASYDLAAELRGQILRILLISGVVDGAMLLGLAVVGMRMLDRIAVLNGKAEQFSAGGRLTTSLSGNDELSYLDRCLCEVAQQIRQSEEQRQTLMAVISHDLRTPLGSILAGLEMLQEGIFGELNPEDCQLLAEAERDLWRLLAQIDDLLCIERLDAGMSEASGPLAELVEQMPAIIDKLRQKWKDAGVELVLNISDAARQSRLQHDSTVTEKVCSALVDNAVAAMTATPVVPVTVDVGVEGDGLSVRVQDAGHGIPEELRTQIFERFRFVEGKPVTGLGLPLSFRLCRAAKARLLIENTSATGTTATIFFSPLSSCAPEHSL